MSTTLKYPALSRDLVFRSALKELEPDWDTMEAGKKYGELYLRLCFQNGILTHAETGNKRTKTADSIKMEI